VWRTRPHRATETSVNATVRWISAGGNNNDRPGFLVFWGSPAPAPRAGTRYNRVEFAAAGCFCPSRLSRVRLVSEALRQLRRS